MFAVIHQDVTLIEHAGDTERAGFPANLAVEDHSGAAERAVGDEDGLAGDGFVNDFVPDENAERIGAGGFAMAEAKDQVVIAHEIGFPRGDILRVIDAGNPVAWWPTLFDILDRDEELGELEAIAFGCLLGTRSGERQETCGNNEDDVPAVHGFSFLSLRRLSVKATFGAVGVMLLHAPFSARRHPKSTKNIRRQTTKHLHGGAKLTPVRAGNRLSYSLQFHCWVGFVRRLAFVAAPFRRYKCPAAAPSSLASVNFLEIA